MDQLRQITVRLDVVEIASSPNHNLEPEEHQDEERLLRVLSRENLKPIVEVVPYDGKLDTNAVLDWISDK